MCSAFNTSSPKNADGVYHRRVSSLVAYAMLEWWTPTLPRIGRCGRRPLLNSFLTHSSGCGLTRVNPAC